MIKKIIRMFALLTVLGLFVAPASLVLFNEKEIQTFAEPLPGGERLALVAMDIKAWLADNLSAEAVDQAKNIFNYVRNFSDELNYKNILENLKFVKEEVPWYSIVIDMPPLEADEQEKEPLQEEGSNSLRPTSKNNRDEHKNEKVVMNTITPPFSSSSESSGISNRPLGAKITSPPPRASKVAKVSEGEHLAPPPTEGGFETGKRESGNSPVSRDVGSLVESKNKVSVNPKISVSPKKPDPPTQSKNKLAKVKTKSNEDASNVISTGVDSSERITPQAVAAAQPAEQLRKKISRPITNKLNSTFVQPKKSEPNDTFTRHEKKNDADENFSTPASSAEQSFPKPKAGSAEEGSKELINKGNSKSDSLVSSLSPSTIHSEAVKYFKGESTPKDLEKAANLFRQAAEMGHAGSQYNLGVMSYLGQGVEKDIKEAARWFMLAAEQGKASAQYNIGSLYFKGAGVERNLKKAFEWIDKAAQQGEPKAIKIREKIKEKLNTS